jgi:hypothetical protein
MLSVQQLVKQGREIVASLFHPTNSALVNVLVQEIQNIFSYGFMDVKIKTN